MELKKANDTYDVYTAKLSYLEMIAIADALRSGGTGPVADELRRSFEWHIDRVPGPGEDKKDLEKKEEEGGEGDGLPPDDLPPAPAGGDTDDFDVAPEIQDEVDDLLPAPPGSELEA
jgi:hypothetical protein